MDRKSLLGKRLRELRKRRNITQEKLSELVSVDPATISNIENGKNYPAMNNLENIIDVLGVSYAEVFDFEHKEPVYNLISKINEIMNTHPEHVELFYKIIKAIVK